MAQIKYLGCLTLNTRRICSPVFFRSILSSNIATSTATRNIPENHSSADDPIVDISNPFEKEKQECILCKYNIMPDYKNVKLLYQFMSPYTGRVYGRHITRLCTEQQRRVEKEIIKAQQAGLMASYLKEVEFLKDPKLFDPSKPVRPHRF